MSEPLSSNARKVLAITACPTGIAHTYMAAENLEAAAKEMGIDLRVETHGSIGVEGGFTPQEIADADAVIIAADTAIEKDRFKGKKLISTGVDAAIKNPKDLLTRSENAPVFGGGAGAAATDSDATPAESGGSGVGRELYQALMNGVSHMVPFVVTGGLMLAVALSIGGEATPEGLVIPEDSFWSTIAAIGSLAFGLMVPVLSAFIASGIAGRPGLAPGFITGLIATTGELYGSEANAGFIGGIITGFLSGYIAKWIKQIPVGKFIQPIMPVIIIPIATTLIVGLLFVYLLGLPLASLFESLSDWLSSLQGASVIVLGAIIGAMIAFDMGGPFNKTAFLFGGGMIAAGNAAPMGMAATAIAVPPLAVGLATLLRRNAFNKSERDSGIAALFMGFFGITEGAIPLAAARPLQVIPANVIGGAVAGALAGWWGVQDNVMHGGPIVALLGAVDNVLAFFAALAIGIAVNAALILLFVGMKKQPRDDDATVETTAATASTATPATEPAREPAPVATAAAAGGSTALATAPKATATTASSTSEKELIDTEVVLLDSAVSVAERDGVIDALVNAAVADGRISDADNVVDAVLEREAKSTTAVGNGVAIPHARTAAVEVPTLGFARLNEPVTDWNAPDGQPVDLVFLIAVPDSAGNKHLKILSKLARSIMKDDFRDQLRGAASEDEIVRIIRDVTPA